MMPISFKAFNCGLLIFKSSNDFIVVVLFCKINYTFGNSIISLININNDLMNQRFLHAFLMLSACWVLLVSCSGSDDPPEPVSNEYELDQAVFEIKTQMFRVTTSDQGAVEQLRLLEPLPDSNLFDLIIISPK